MDEYWEPLLGAMTLEKLKNLKALISRAEGKFLLNISTCSTDMLLRMGILWVTRPVENDIYAAFDELVFGFARSIRSEKPNLKFVVLRLEAHSTSMTSIARVFEHAFIRYPGILDSDVDYKECKGRFRSLGLCRMSRCINILPRQALAL